MQISTSRTRITPEGPFFPCYLLGHAIRTEKALGVADELWASALVLKIEETTLIWVSVDLAGFNKRESDQLRSELSPTPIPDRNMIRFPRFSERKKPRFPVIWISFMPRF